VKFELDFLLIQTALSILLAMFRIQGFFIAAPIFSRRAIPAIIKIGISFVFCFWFYESIFNSQTNILQYNAISLFTLIFIEFTIGFLFGLIINLVFDGILSFAHLLGTQFGMSSANIFNSSIATPTNPTGIFFSALSFIFFLKFDGLYNLSYIMKKSFELIPMNNYSVGLDLMVTNFASVFSHIFIISLKFVLPLIAIMFVVDVFVAIFSKILPQASMFFLIMPNKLILAAILSIFFLIPFQNGIETYFNDTILDLLDELFILD
jgi:flagellar biosynthesis protein FliR